jgi:IS605 OrfB family transposase
VTLLAYRYARSCAGQREAERSYGIAGDDLTPSISWSLYSLRKDWNAAKGTVAPWWPECSKEAFNTGLDQLARSLNWSDTRSGKRKGRGAGFSRFRSRRRARPSVRFTTGAIRCEATQAVLPRLGRIRLHERPDMGNARILSATVRHVRGRWFVAFTAEQDIVRPAPSRPDVSAGIDLGIKTLAVVAASTGQTFGVPNPRHLSGALRKIRRMSRAVSRRQGPDRRTGQRPSSRWRRADAARNRAVARVADQREDGIHKLTTSLARTYGTIVIEDLHVAGMVRNRRLARHVSDASFGEIRRQLAYKTEWHGGRLIVADRWFASSKTCSGCGAAKAKLALSERTYACTACGLVLDRDVNAALNLARLAASGADSNGRGADRKTGLARQVAVKRQPGRARARQTGTLPPQGESAA